ncbi:MAG: hypothetical protein U0521_10285 [Anaerolineae bacterium]
MLDTLLNHAEMLDPPLLGHAPAVMLDQLGGSQDADIGVRNSCEIIETKRDFISFSFRS